MKNNKLVYGWFNDKECFYVGMGSQRRSRSRLGRNPHCARKRKLAEQSKTFRVEVFDKELTVDQACRLEIELIKELGRRDLNTGRLTNMTDGGEGMLNYKFTSEQKMKQSLNTKNYWHSLSDQDKEKRDRKQHRGYKPWLHRKRSQEEREKCFQVNTQKKTTVTPLGIFPSCSTAAKAEKRCNAYISSRCNNPENKEYYYL